MKKVSLTLAQQLGDDHCVLGLYERLGVAVRLEVVARVHRKPVGEVARIVTQAPLANAYLRRARDAHLRQAVSRARRLRRQTELLQRQHHHLRRKSTQQNVLMYRIEPLLNIHTTAYCRLSCMAY